MSERASFTSQYIENRNDYSTLLEFFEKEGNSKYLCVAPPASWTREHDGEVFEQPVIQGHIKSFAAQLEWLNFYKIIKGLVTEEDVVFVIISEDVTQITEIVKKANGDVEAYDLIRNECLM